MTRYDAAILALSFGVLSTCGTDPDPMHAEFVVDVESERFVARVRDPETMTRFRDALAGRASGFPAGPLLSGDGGFNAPWSWHIDPDEIRLVEAAIEVCDGTPSYVEAHLSDFPTYCPWGARVVLER
ncbi:MAG TPA: hypothetical protein VJ921_01765 [Vicinamibacteria bacterium]|nr:hypothetical protein [Vicinamibacteria bacterium]